MCTPINEPYHQRRRLTKYHCYNSVLHGDRFHCSIIECLTGKSSHGFTINFETSPDYKDLLFGYQEKAQKWADKEMRERDNYNHNRSKHVTALRVS